MAAKASDAKGAALLLAGLGLLALLLLAAGGGRRSRGDDAAARGMTTTGASGRGGMLAFAGAPPRVRDPCAEWREWPRAPALWANLTARAGVDRARFAPERLAAAYTSARVDIGRFVAPPRFVSEHVRSLIVEAAKAAGNVTDAAYVSNDFMEDLLRSGVLTAHLLQSPLLRNMTTWEGMDARPGFHEEERLSIALSDFLNGRHAWHFRHQRHGDTSRDGDVGMLSTMSDARLLDRRRGSGGADNAAETSDDWRRDRYSFKRELGVPYDQFAASMPAREDQTESQRITALLADEGASIVERYLHAHHPCASGGGLDRATLRIALPDDFVGNGVHPRMPLPADSAALSPDAKRLESPGARGWAFPFHFDCFDNLIVILSGAKRVVSFPRAALLPPPLHDEDDTPVAAPPPPDAAFLLASLLTEHELDLLPHLLRAHAVAAGAVSDVTVSEGDALLVPVGHMHFVQAVGGPEATVSMHIPISVCEDSLPREHNLNDSLHGARDTNSTAEFCSRFVKDVHECSPAFRKSYPTQRKKFDTLFYALPYAHASRSVTDD